MNTEIMELYKRHKVNPLGGCLPMVLQIPVFFGLYQAAREHHPAAPRAVRPVDPRPVGARAAGLLGYGIPVLTLLLGASMFLQQKMSPPAGDPTQQKIMMFMPIVFTFMFIGFPAGLTLYWLTNNVLTIAQQYFMHPRRPVRRPPRDVFACTHADAGDHALAECWNAMLPAHVPCALLRAAGLGPILGATGRARRRSASARALVVPRSCRRYVEDTIAALATAAGSRRDRGRPDERPRRGRDRAAGSCSRATAADDAAAAAARTTPGSRCCVIRCRGRAVDQVLALPMLAPRSFTGEDVVEIHCHGGTPHRRAGARAAARGGGARGASGRVHRAGLPERQARPLPGGGRRRPDEASSEAGGSAARQQLEGRLSQEILAVRDLRSSTLRALARRTSTSPRTIYRPNRARRSSRPRCRRRRRDSPRLVGDVRARPPRARGCARRAGRPKPNVGKSSLLNALLGRERAS